MNIIISNNKDIPIYEQLVNQLKESIITDKLSNGEMLPSIRTLARDLKISVITTKKAYEVLEKEGYIETIPAKGSYVSNKNNNLIKEEILKNIENGVIKIIYQAKLGNIKKEDVIDIFEYLYEEGNNE